MSGVVIDVQARQEKAQKDLEQLRVSLGNIEKTTTNTAKSFKRLGQSIALAAGGILTSGYFRRVSDDFTNMSNRIRLVTGETDNLALAQNRLIAISQKTRTSFGASTEVFNRFGIALKAAKTPIKDILTVTETIQKAVAVSGVSAESANAALLQLGQGLAAGQLRGQELNSVMEQTPRIARAIADSLDVGVGKLRALAEAGTLTTDVVFKALSTQADSISSDFEKLVPTIQQSLLVLNQSFKLFSSGFFKGLGTDNAIANFAVNLSKTFTGASEDITIRTAIFVSKTKSLFAGLGSLVKPLAGVFKEIGKTILVAIPRPKIVRTLERDLNKLTIDIAKAIVVPFRRVQNSLVSALERLDIFGARPVRSAIFDIFDIDFSASKTSLVAYGKALENLSKALASSREENFLTTLINDSIGLERSIASLGRYFGAFTDTFIIFRSGAPAPFKRLLFEIASVVPRIGREIRILKFLILDAAGEFGPLLARFLSVDDSIKSMFNNTSRLQRALGRGSSNIFYSSLESAKKFTYVLKNFDRYTGRIVDSFSKKLASVGGDNDLLGNMGEYFTTLGDSIVDISDYLRDAFQDIAAFGEDVIGVFFKIWDEVIGHSWWTDTIDAVVSSSNSLVANTRDGFRRFETFVISSFEKISKKVAKSASFSVSLGVVDDFKKSDVFANALNFDKLGESFAGRAKALLDVFRDEFPNLFKSIFLAISSVAVSLLFPAGRIKKALLAGIFGALIATSSLIADAFGSDRLNAGLFKELSTTAGKAAAGFINGLVANIPAFVTAFIDTIAGATRGFLSNLGLGIGAVFSSLFAVTDVVGLSNPLGLYFAYLFGKGPASLLFESKRITKVVDVFKRAATAPIFLKLQRGGGLIFATLFGGSKVKLVAAIGLALEAIGVLEGFISNDLVRGLVDVGLLSLLFFGNKGAAVMLTALDTIKASVIGTLSGISGSVLGRTAQAGLLYSYIFGSSSLSTSSISQQLTRVIRGFKTAVSGLFSGGGVILSVLFGRGANLSVVSTALTSLKYIVLDALAPILLFGTRLRKALTFTAGASGVGVFVGKAIAGIAAVTAVLEKLPARLAGLVGPVGLLGNFFLGKTGVAILLGTIGLLFSSLAGASQAVNEDFDKITYKINDNEAAFTSFADNMRLFAKENPLVTAFAAVASAGIIPLIGQVGRLTARSKELGKIGKRTSLKEGKKTTSQLAAGGSAAAVGISTGDIFTTVLTYVGIEKLVEFVWSKITKSFARRLTIFSTVARGLLLGALTSLGGIVATGAVIAGGFALAVLGDSKVWQERVRENLGHVKDFFFRADAEANKRKPAGVRRFGGLLEDEGKRVRANPYNIRTDFNEELSKVRPTALTERQIDRVNDALEQYAELLGEVRVEQSENGQVTEETANRVNEFAKQVENSLKKVKNASRFDFSETRKDINSLNEVEPFGFFDKFKLKALEFARYADFASRQLPLLANIAVSDSEEAAKRLDDLFKARDNHFNAYRPVPTDILADLQKDLDFGAKLGTFGNLGNLDDKLVGELHALEDSLVIASEEIRNDKELSKAILESIYTDDVFNAPAKVVWYQKLFSEYKDTVDKLNKEQSEYVSNIATDSRINAVGKLLEDTGIEFDKDTFKRLGIDYQTALDDLAKELDKAAEAVLKAGAGPDSEFAQNSLKTLVFEWEAKYKIGDVETSLDKFSQAISLADTAGLDIENDIIVRLDKAAMGETIDGLKNLSVLASNLAPSVRKSVESGGKIPGLEAYGIPQNGDIAASIRASYSFLLDLINAKRSELTSDLISRPSLKGSEALTAFTGVDVSAASLAQIPSARIPAFDDTVQRIAKYQQRLKAALESGDTSKAVLNAKFVVDAEFDLQNLKTELRSVSEEFSDATNLIEKDTLLRISSANFDKVLGISKRIAEINKLLASTRISDLSDPAAFFREMYGELQRLEERAERISRTVPKLLSFDDVFNQIKSLGADISPAKFLSLPAAIKEDYKALAANIARIKENLADNKYKGDREGQLRQLIKQEKEAKELYRDNSDIYGRFALVKQALPELAISLDGFASLSDAVSDKLFVTSRNILDDQQKLIDKVGTTSNEVLALANTQADIVRASTRELANVADTGGKLGIINQLFGITLKEYARLGSGARASLLDMALGYKEQEGVILSSKGALAVNTKARLGELEAIKESGREIALAGRAFGQATSELFSDVDVSITPEQANRLSSAQYASLDNTRVALQKALKALDSNELTDTARIAGQRLVDKLSMTMREGILLSTLAEVDTQVYQAGKSFSESIVGNLKDGLKGVLKQDKSVGDFLLDVVSNYANSILDAAVDGMFSALTKKGGALDSIFEDIGANVFGGFADLFGGNDEPKYDTEKGIAEAHASRDKIRDDLAKANTQKIVNALANPVAKSFGLGDIPSSIAGIDIPVMDGGFSEVSGIFSGFEGFGFDSKQLDPNHDLSPTTNKSIFGLQDSFGSELELTSKISDATIVGSLDSVGAITSSGFSGIGDIFSKGLNGMGTLLGNLFSGSGGGGVASSLLNLATSVIPLFFANGGPVSGKGSGTSDDILARVSNGEFIINAKSTEKNRKLLEFINSGGSLRDILKGDLQAFAEGGLAGTSLASSRPSDTGFGIIRDTEERRKNQAVEQTFHINVTGDVSMQTRKEIQKMVPEIAVGVNSHNNELGYTGIR